MPSPPTLVIIPGWKNSDSGHWQSLLAEQWPGAIRIEQRDWHTPLKQDWVNTITNTILAQSGAVILAAHSLGCIAAVQLPHAATERIEGALLVAPADPLRRAVLSNFAPVPLAPLAYKSIVVSSDNDPYCPVSLAQHYAQAWGSEIVSLPQAGHINTESGFGHWPEGVQLLQKLSLHATERALSKFCLQ